jgi:hypothetical protein
MKNTTSQITAKKLIPENGIETEAANKTIK